MNFAPTDERRSCLSPWAIGLGLGFAAPRRCLSWPICRPLPKRTDERASAGRSHHARARRGAGEVHSATRSALEANFGPTAVLSAPGFSQPKCGQKRARTIFRTLDIVNGQVNMTKCVLLAFLIIR